MNAAILKRVVLACRRSLCRIVGWSAVGLLLLWAWHLKHPLMYFLRPLETPLLVAVGLIGGICFWQRRRGIVWGPARLHCNLGLLAMGAVLWLTLAGEFRFREQKQAVLAAAPEMMQLGEHFIVGFDDWDKLDALAGRGLIGGIYVTGRNIRGMSATEVKTRIARLQARRTRAGLPPLRVAADQEGGKIAHLSPLLPAMPALATLTVMPPQESADAAFAYGEKQGRALAGLGVNLNLSPVVDLKPEHAIMFGDTHTRIQERAISGDPKVVTRIAEAYSAGLRTAGVQPTLKHFPGLRLARQDTHHSSARLYGGTDNFARDWAPFQAIGAKNGAAIMLGHVTLANLDPDHAVSHSRKIVQGVLRESWAYDGLLITDDLNMGAVYGKGIGRVATDALNAGVDFVLVSYDPDQYYRAIHHAARMLRRGVLNEGMLAQSHQRLAASGYGRGTI